MINGEGRMLSSPMSNSNQTFLSGTGVFDWNQSRLMEDVINNRVQFSVPDLNQNAYSEQEVFDLISEIKET